MRFNGFTKDDFETFATEGLDARMEAIQTRIQPKFQAIGEELTTDIATMAGNDMFLHIARHARRTVNPPNDTWLAICHDKRGYKKHPHFQVGLFEDHVFVWLAFINELENKKEIGQTLLKNKAQIKKIIPSDFVVSFDHMKKEAYSMDRLNNEDFEELLQRFRDIKKSELLFGRHIMSNDPILKDGNRFLSLAKDTFETLMPLYQLAYA